MSDWDTYAARLNAPLNSSGNPERDSALSHIQDRMRRKITASLSYKTVKIGDSYRNIAVTDTQDFSIKKIFSLPGEDLPHGSIVDWADSKWLITELNAHSEFCSEGKMQRCNYYLKWIDSDGNVVGKWCIVADGTKYLIGEKSEDIMTIGDARISVTIGKDSDTEKLSRGKRFLIDDMESKEVLAYAITKPNKLFNVFNGKGVFRFILGEVNLTDADNTELRIADYYSWKPTQPAAKSDVQTGATVEQIVNDAIEKEKHKSEDIEERKVWL